MSTLVAKVYSHFKVSKLNEVAFLRNRINSTCMLFLSMYTFIIPTMRLCEQRNNKTKRTEGSEDLIHKHPNSRTHEQHNIYHLVTFLNVYSWRNLDNWKSKTLNVQYCEDVLWVWIIRRDAARDSTRVDVSINLHALARHSTARVLK